MDQAIIQNILTQAQDAIDHIDDVLARKLLAEIKNILSNQQSQLDSQTFQQLSDTQIKLKLVSLPNLPEEEAITILRKNYLDSFDIGVDMENRLTALLFFYPEIPRDEIREKLKIALLQNQQRLGNLTVSQWLQDFEKLFPVKTRSLSAPVEFVVKHPQAQPLNPLEKKHLKELLHTYDYLLITTLPATGPILENILSAVAPAAPTEKGSVRSYAAPAVSERWEEGRMETVYFNDALSHYPAFGEQLVTSGKIKLAGLPEPVRPSIKNWIADFTSGFGYERNNPIKRQDYLFRSANGNNLSQSERERLSFVLKSFEENSLISLNKNTRMLFFGETPSAEKEEQIKGGTVSFDFHQKMPFEKKSAPEITPDESFQPLAPVNTILTKTAFRPNSNPNLIKIPPKATPVPKNVVNLKEL